MGQHIIEYDNTGKDELIVRWMNTLIHFHPTRGIIIAVDYGEGYPIIFEGDELELHAKLGVKLD